MLQYLVTFTCILLAAVLTAAAQDNRTMTLQGVFTDEQGVARPDGTYRITIRLYDSATGGTPRASFDGIEAQQNGGAFTIEIPVNAVAAVFKELDKNFPGRAVDHPYLAVVEADGNERVPRMRVGAVPYASHATTASRSIGDVPVGTLQAFMGRSDVLPDTWMPCDGRPVSSAQYPELFAAIGTFYGDGSDDDDSSTDFNLPDARGSMLMGVGDAPYDPSTDPPSSVRSTSSRHDTVKNSVGNIRGREALGLGSGTPVLRCLYILRVR
jgi:Phage Tail Collar Domain